MGVGEVADPGGGATGAPPPPLSKFDQYYFVSRFVLSECFKIRLRQHERASKTLKLPGPISWPCPVPRSRPQRDIELRARDVGCAHMFCAPSTWKSWIRLYGRGPRGYSPWNWGVCCWSLEPLCTDSYPVLLPIPMGYQSTENGQNATYNCQNGRKCDPWIFQNTYIISNC